MDDRDIIRLKSGAEVYANNGIIGISPDLAVHEGYDGTILYGRDINDLVAGKPRARYDVDIAITAADAIELCELAIERWTALLKKMRGL